MYIQHYLAQVKLLMNFNIIFIDKFNNVKGLKTISIQKKPCSKYLYA